VTRCKHFITTAGNVSPGSRILAQAVSKKPDRAIVMWLETWRRINAHLWVELKDAPFLYVWRVTPSRFVSQ